MPVRSSPKGGYGVRQLDRARKGLGFSTLMAASAGTIAFMFVMGAPSTRILATGNEFFGFIDVWELFAHQRDEQAARATFLFRQQLGSFWLGPN